jgi:L-lactate utilization protein LutC
MGSEFERSATDETIDKLVATLGANNIEAIVVANRAEARRGVLELVPEGAEVNWAKSKTLEDLGLDKEFLESGRYDALRNRYLKMDRATQGREIRKLTAAPDYMLGSVNAITEDGELVIVSYSATQLGPLASGAGRLILVVGTQKIVANLDEAMRRVREHAFPYEDARLRETLGVPTKMAKVLIINAETRPGRTTVFLVKELVGV